MVLKLAALWGLILRRLLWQLGHVVHWTTLLALCQMLYIPYLQDASICQGPLEKLQKHMKNVIYGLIAARL
jgi:hypothetical protein